MQKAYSADLRGQYARTLELSAVISLTLIIIAMLVFKKFETAVIFQALEAPAIQVEDIPVTRAVKKIIVPPKPVVPVIDPEVSPELDISIPDVDIYEIPISTPPPSPDIIMESYPIWKVEIAPVLIGGTAAIADYIMKNNLFPKIAASAGVNGKVMIGFTVGINGRTRDVHLITETPEGLGFGEAGIKVMQAMIFSPGQQRDKLVPVTMTQPITFSISN